MKNQVLVTDSGIGGLNVLQKMRQKMPHLNFVYFADEAYCPYGEKTPEAVRQRTEKILNTFANVTMLNVIACNTASVCLTAEQRTKYSPVADAICPTVNEIVACHPRKVAVLATGLTVGSGVYAKRLAAQGIMSVSVDCGRFVRLLERDVADDRQRVADEVLCDVAEAGCDCVALCCTHFDYLAEEIGHTLKNATVVSSSQALADRCVRLLSNLSSDARGKSGEGRTVYLSSKIDDVSTISRQIGCRFQPFAL